MIISNFSTNVRGFTPQVVIPSTDLSGTILIATCSNKIVKSIFTDLGVTINLPDYGTWNLSYTHSELTYQTTLEVDTIKQFKMALSNLKLVVLDKFSDNSWETIIYACQTNSVPDTWLVGDSKEMTVDGFQLPVIIIGKNHDDYSDGSGKAPLTLLMVVTQSYYDYYDSLGKLDEMGFRGTMLNVIDENPFSWMKSSFYNEVIPASKKLLPEIVQNSLRKVNKECVTNNGGTDFSKSVVENEIFLLSYEELLGQNKSPHIEGTQYEYFSAGNTFSKYDTCSRLWLRTPNLSSNFEFFCVLDARNWEHPFNCGTCSVDSLSVGHPVFCF